MNPTEQTALSVLGAIGIAAGGWIADFILYRFLKGVARRTQWWWGNAIAESLRRTLFASTIVVAVFWLVRWITLPASLILIMDRVLLVAGIGIATVALLRFAIRAVRHWLHATDSGLPAVSILVNVVRLGIIIVAALIVLQVLGIPIAPLLTALGIGGLALALALQDTLSNLFAGLHILAARQVRPGDFVRLDTGHEGVVEDVNWRNTTIRTLGNNVVIIPNSRLANAVLVNYRVPEPELSVTVPIQVAYGSDLELVERVTLEVARGVQQEVEGAVREFQPLVRLQEFTDYGIRLLVILRAEKAEDQYLLRHEFLKRLLVAYRSAGIEIPFPTHRVTGDLQVSWSPREFPLGTA
ncbi:MAG: mechanosensitive ion channel family protein [Candidatus Kapabacteria bacterium]|nr:mechanosensitive ion channel family protein [Candidatus Kapabacteria bacterium]MDW8012359.1 mechanosensitive ion channel family protein [Bacteroidota bacterium]